MSNIISTVFILAFSLYSSYFALSLCRIGTFDFLFCFYALEGRAGNEPSRAEL